MEIFSKGGFYFGIDNAKFNDVSIHLGNFRLEYSSNPTANRCPYCEPSKKTGDRSSDS